MPEFISSPDLTPLGGVSHGFFTRRGGVSIGLFDSLNCSLSSGDDVAAVSENRRRVVRALGGELLITNKQVHGRVVRVVGQETDPAELIEADGLVTREAGVCIGALGADCAPVLFADETAGIIGAAHAGWQGALNGVTDAVVAEMERQGARRELIRCAVGPSIQVASYEVGREFQDNFSQRSLLDSARFFKRHEQTGNVHFDLPGYIVAMVEAAGIIQVDNCNIDTYVDHHRYFSYRRCCHLGEKQYGRQIGAICLQSE